MSKKSRLVTLRQAKQILHLNSKSKYLEQFTYGKNAIVKPVNAKKKGDEEFLYYLDDILTIVFNPPYYETFIKNLSKQIGFVTMDALSKIFNVSKSVFIKARDDGKLETLIDMIPGEWGRSRFEFENKYSSIDNLIDTTSFKSRKFLLSLEVRSEEEFKKVFNPNSGYLTLEQFSSISKVDERNVTMTRLKRIKRIDVDFSSKHFGNLRVFMSQMLPIVLVRFDDDRWLTWIVKDPFMEYEESILNSLLLNNYAVDSVDSKEIIDYLQAKGAMIIDSYSLDTRCSDIYKLEDQEEIVKDLIVRTSNGVDIFPEKLSFNSMDGSMLLITYHSIERSIQDENLEAKIPFDEFEGMIRLAKNDEV